MSDRIFNFSAGPCCLPIEVLEECQKDMTNYKGCGMSVMEMSHRSKEFVNIFNQAEKDLRDILSVPDRYKVLFLQGKGEVLNVPDRYEVLFLQGGATLQFSSIPMNLFGSGKTHADYAVTGQWGEKAFKETMKYGTPNKVCDTKGQKYTHIPAVESWELGDADKTAYLHYCANETVNGVEFHSTPDITDRPLVADMSSNFLSKPIDIEKHAVIYAGAQKNLGPAGNCVVLVDEDYIGKELPATPAYCNWKTAADAGSMYNTPACYSIYVTGVYLQYTKEKGGVHYWNELSDKKSGMLYDAIDGSDGFYSNPVAKDARSRMNIPFQIMGGDEILEKKFLEEAKKMKLFTLAGHRSVGGIRASVYNGMPLEGVQTLTEFMKSFAEENRE